MAEPAPPYREGGPTPLERSAEHGFTPVGRSAEHGFTLIEIMVALAVFALAVLALVRLESATVRGAGSIDETLAAAMLARTVTAEAVSDARAPAVGRAAGQATNGGRPWRWTRAVERTDDARVLRIDVAVVDPRGVRRASATAVRSTVGEAAR